MADTIFALATPPGRAGVAIIRVSGPKSEDVLERLCGAPLPPPRYLSLRELQSDGELLDRALAVRFVAGASYTGEDMCEFHVHGGRATVSRVLTALSGVGGVRGARPGEFTRRALESGALDLSQAEAVADLIDSDTEAQRKQALAVMEGALSSEVSGWRAHLVQALALVEASIDFADEEDAPTDVTADVQLSLSTVQRQLEGAIEGAQLASRVREGFVVALVGPPNVGKSTLINVIAGEEAAIVSPVAGTTRDVIHVSASLDGLPVTFLDMAGIREAGDTIEELGVSRAIRHAEDADLRLFLSSWDTGEIGADLWKEGDVTVWTKADQGSGPGEVSISALTGVGVDALLAKVASRLLAFAPRDGLFAHARHQEDLRSGAEALGRALRHDAGELIAEEIRVAVRHLDLLVGSVDVETVLDEVFSRFCIGK